MEKCCQRMLVEYQRMLVESGTPSAIWRRTGEIVYVSEEFSFLTQWSLNDVVATSALLLDFVDDETFIRYVQAFTNIAFNNSQQTVSLHCPIRTKSGSTIPAVLCFTIKRCIVSD